MSFRTIKQCIIDCSKGLPTKILFHNEKSLTSATTYRIKFNPETTPMELDATAVKFKLKRIINNLGITEFDQKDWVLAIKVHGWDDDLEQKKGPQSFTRDACEDYKIWEHFSLHAIDNDLITIIFECNETRARMRNKGKPKPQSGSNDNRFNRASEGKSASHRRINNRKTETQIRQEFVERLRDPQYQDVVNELNSNPYLLAHCIRKVASAQNSNIQPHSFEDAVKEVRRRMSKSQSNLSRRKTGNIARNDKDTSVNRTLLQPMIQHKQHQYHANVNMSRNNAFTSNNMKHTQYHANIHYNNIDNNNINNVPYQAHIVTPHNNNIQNSKNIPHDQYQANMHNNSNNKVQNTNNIQHDGYQASIQHNNNNIQHSQNIQRDQYQAHIPYNNDSNNEQNSNNIQHQAHKQYINDIDNNNQNNIIQHQAHKQYINDIDNNNQNNIIQHQAHK
eukprot:452564_1